MGPIHYKNTYICDVKPQHSRWGYGRSEKMHYVEHSCVFVLQGILSVCIRCTVNLKSLLSLCKWNTSDWQLAESDTWYFSCFGYYFMQKIVRRLFFFISVDMNILVFLSLCVCVCVWLIIVRLPWFGFICIIFPFSNSEMVFLFICLPQTINTH